MVFGSIEPRQELTTITDPDTGCPTSNTARVQDVIEQHFRELVRAPSGSKHGQYLPEQVPRNYPWQAGGKGDLETFQLQTDATEPGKRRWLAEYATDEAVFFECLKSLSSGKAPGPDKIGNELLKMLPVRVKKLIHKLFTLMWVTGITPAVAAVSCDYLGDGLFRPAAVSLRVGMVRHDQAQPEYGQE
jgi:hypothetical protein